MADGGRYRRRRYACFTIDGLAGRGSRTAPTTRALGYNGLNGGIDRWFTPVEPRMGAHPLLARLLERLAAAFAEAGGLVPGTAAAWLVEMHQFRIVADPRRAGLPTPEGRHRDGVDWVAVVLVGRHNVAGGVTAVTDGDRPRLGTFTLDTPLDTVLLDDHRVWHGVTPVHPVDDAAPAHRDVLVLTFRDRRTRRSGRAAGRYCEEPCSTDPTSRGRRSTRRIAHLWYCRNPPGPRRLERSADRRRTTGRQTAGRRDAHLQAGTAGGVPRPRSGSILSGVATRYQIIDTSEQEHVVGVSVPARWDAALRPRAGAPPAAATSRSTRCGARVRRRGCASNLLAAADGHAALDVLEAALRRAWRRPVHPPWATPSATSAPADVARVAEVAGRDRSEPGGASSKLRGRGRVTPNRYCRLLRFQEAAAPRPRRRDAHWAEVALALGLLRPGALHPRLQGFSGLTPTGYHAAGRHFRTTSLFYNPPATEIGEHPPWLTTWIPTAR